MAAPHYQIIRRPIITEKGLGVKETQHTVVFEVAAAATKTETARSGQTITTFTYDYKKTRYGTYDFANLHVTIDRAGVRPAAALARQSA